MVSVAIAQFAPTSHKAWNLGKIEELADQAATGGARIIVFPEYSSWFSDKLDAEFFDHAEELDGPFVNRLKDVAAQKKLVIVAGMLERLAGSDQSRVSNTVVAVGVDGTVLARYRKVHLYDAFGSCESDWIRSGDIVNPETFDIGDLKFGIQTCHDPRFPEVTRTLVDAGVDVVILPAERVAGLSKLDHWTILIRARAIENTVYVLAADHPRPIGVGNSMVVGPAGDVDGCLLDDEGLLIAEVNLDEIAAVRSRNPSVGLRRFAVVPA